MTPPEKYVLRLYVTGLTPRSTRAIKAVRDVCEQHLRGRYELEIIDVYQQPARISTDQIIAIPKAVEAGPTVKDVCREHEISDATSTDNRSRR